jgi:glutamate-1-semialdehyde 2,1-aminomutase
MFSMGSIFWLSFSNAKEVRRADAIDPKGMNLFAPLHRALLERGVYLGPSGYEVGFISAAHRTEHLTAAADAFIESLDEVYAKAMSNAQ